MKALLGFDAIVGNYASPYTPGTAYVLLHHAFGEVNGKKRVWGHAIGGMGAITQAMARAAAAHGVEIETDAPVREVLIEKGRVCRRGARGRARRPRRRGRRQRQSQAPLYGDGAERRARCRTFCAACARWRCGSGTFRMNVALSRLPSFTALPGQRAGGSSHRRHHPGAEPRLHGSRLRRCAPARLEPRADHRDAHPLDPGRYAGAAGGARGEPVLPARGAGTAGRQLVERPSRHAWPT